MPFVRVEKSSRTSFSSVEPVVTMGSYLADGKVHKSRSVTFRISRPLLDLLGWEVQGSSIGISINEGTGSDQGYVQLVYDNARGYRASTGGNNEDKTRQGVSVSVTIERFKHYVLNECPVPSALVNHIVDDNTLIVECPDWLRYNPQSVPEPQPVVEEPKRPLPRQSSKQDKSNSVDAKVEIADLSLHLNRRERRLLANKIAGKLR